EVTQFTYFQQAGGLELDPITLELTYGLERIAMFIQAKESVFDLDWTKDYTYGDIHKQDEVQYSTYNFTVADTAMLFQLFDTFEKECQRLLKEDLVLPAYDYVLKCSHAFNMLDARGAIGVTQRTGYIGRVRNLARRCAENYVQLREALHWPLLKDKPIL
ncbi:MAG TPA: glycine--tRNA ligase subunit alpha, partial [Candidatus Wunengus sp. YC64]|uniref:glycine--tRNA ligase subunit alpha n=1 Tax=Candidatus Wunengus sp. YC64 TaxID=3367700 RepID=UPI004028472E